MYLSHYDKREKDQTKNQKQAKRIRLISNNQRISRIQMIEVEVEHLLTELALGLCLCSFLCLDQFHIFWGHKKRQKLQNTSIHFFRLVYMYQIDAHIKYSFEKSMRIGMEGSNKKVDKNLNSSSQT